MKKLIKVLVCDDSVLVRTRLSEIINSDVQLQVSATASDPYEAAQQIKKEIPDVITLDLQMPKMNGLTFLRTLMSQHPVPVVIVSSFSSRGSVEAIRALQFGAVEIVDKSEINIRASSTVRLTDAIKAAYLAPVRKLNVEKLTLHQGSTNISGANSLQPRHNPSTKIIAIGASTGGPEALRYILCNLSDHLPGILIAQHMPSGFTRSLAESINAASSLTVKEAHDNEPIVNGHAYIAPGGKHMIVSRTGVGYCIKVKDGEVVNHHKPSVDVMFQSVALHAGKQAVGILLTGMGKDGASGLLKMKECGAETIAQDEKSSIVYGMPGEAVKLGAADKVMTLQEIAVHLRKK